MSRPDMSHVEITIPEVGQTTSEVTLIKWHKRPGDPVQRGDVLAELETDKMVVELESFAQGTLVELRAKEGEVVSMGTVVAIIESDTGAAAKPPVTAVAGGVSPQAQKPPSPSFAAPDLKVEPAPAPIAEAASQPKASPAAKALARRLGTKLENMEGTGPGKLIIRRNVLESMLRNLS